jgi:hypothetical protein
MFTGGQTAGFGAMVSADDLEDDVIYTYDRWLSIGRGDVGSAIEGALEAKGVPTGKVGGWVVEKGTGVAVSNVHVFAYRAGAAGPWLEWTTDIGEDVHPDGSFGGRLPPGDWELVVHGEGRPTSTRIPVTVSEGEETKVVLESPQPGSIEYNVVDSNGYLIPAKVSFFRADGEATRRPDLGIQRRWPLPPMDMARSLYRLEFTMRWPRGGLSMNSTFPKSLL